MSSYTEEQEIFSLAWTAYVGTDLVGANHAWELHRRLAQRLSRTAPVQNRWQLAWGPAASQLQGIPLPDDSMAYLAVTRDSPGEIAIAIRGTNPFSLNDWLSQNFPVDNPVSWPYAPSSPGARVSRGTLLGLSCLEALLPDTGLPGEGTGILPALRQLLTERAGARVCVTGHSLGGVLATTFALLLADRRAEWDPRGNTPLRVWSFAAPTAGNPDFAFYTERRLGNSLHRVFNDHDIVPCAWDPDLLRLLGDAYTHWGNRNFDFLLGPSMRVFGDLLRARTGGATYRQPPQGEQRFSSPFRFGLPFVLQVLHQHGQAYIEELELTHILSQFDVVGLRSFAGNSLAGLQGNVDAALVDLGVDWPLRGPLPSWGRALGALWG